MEFKKPASIFLIFLILDLFLVSCQVNEPHMPSWDVSLNVPIAKKSYTLMDVLEKSSELKYYTDASRNNLLYYSQEATLDKITIQDKLKIDGANKVASETIGSISIASDSIQTNIGYEWLGLGGNPSGQVVLPPIGNQQVTANFDVANQFQSVKLDAGTLDLVVTNQFPSPVAITVSNVKIKNTATGEIVAQDTRSIIIPAKSSGTFNSIPITTNLTIKNQLSFECTVSSTGSGGTSITLPQSTLSVKARLKNLSAIEATAKIPAQDPVVIDNSITIDEGAAQSTKFSTVKIDNGTLNINVVNNLDLNATITMTINSLKDSQGKVFSETRLINRKQSSQIINNLSLQNYTLVSTTGSPVNTVSYKISIIPETTVDVRTIKSTDGITGTVSISNLQLKEFTGILQPTSISAQRSSVSLNVKDLKNKLQFGEINLKNPIAQLRLSTTAQFEMQLTGHIEATNKLGQRAVIGLNSKTLSPAVITPSDSVITINADSLSLFFKKFSVLPDSLIVFAGGTLNPNYKSISVKNTDQVTGKSRLELPFELGIQNAVLKDSVKVDLSSDDRDNIKNVNSLVAGLKITNGLAASVAFTGKMYDKNNNFLTYFPPKYSDQDTVIVLNGATTNSSGDVITKNEQTISVKLLKADADKLSNATYMRVIVKMNTSASGNSPVKFKTTDDLQLSAFGSTNYQITPKENSK